MANDADATLKQEFLRDEILNDGYDAQKFLEYITSLKGKLLSQVTRKRW